MLSQGDDWGATGAKKYFKKFFQLSYLLFFIINKREYFISSFNSFTPFYNIVVKKIRMAIAIRSLTPKKKGVKWKTRNKMKSSNY